MYIITDCKDYTENILAIAPNWQNFSGNSTLQIIKKITTQLFKKNDLFTTEINADPLWKYLLIVNHSQSSQFTSLIELSKNEPDLPSGILCLAASGENFKGYKNRNWVTLLGNIHFSAYLKPNQIVDHFHIGFTIISALSVIETLDKISGLEQKASIKWVNDVFIEDGKVAGVLTQTQTIGKKVTDLFVGIGINVKSTPVIEDDFFVKKAASIEKYMDNGNQNSLSKIFKNLLHYLTTNYKLLLSGKYNQILNAYRERSTVIGKNTIVYSDPVLGDPKKIAEGKVISIGDNLELHLENQKEPVVRGRVVINSNNIKQ